jgi:hypothetical protein
MVHLLLKKFLAFYGTEWFIVVFTRSRHYSLSWARWSQIAPSPLFFKINFIIIFPSTPYIHFVCLYEFVFEGCAVANAFSLWLATVGVWVWPQVVSCGICAGQRGIKDGFSPSASVLPNNSRSINCFTFINPLIYPTRYTGSVVK